MRKAKAILPAATLLVALGASTTADAAPSLADYRYFRALSVDLKGRIPSTTELAAFEAPGFDLDKWVDDALAGPAYAERVRRVYMDLLRLSIGRSFQFVPGRTTLRVQKIHDESGNEVLVYFRQGQRRADALTDGEFCFPKTLTGQTYPPFTAAKDDPAGAGVKNVPKAEIDKRTVLVKPWWLYRDYDSASPKDLYGDSWATTAPGFVPAAALVQDANKNPITQVRVCKEEALTADTGTIYASGLTKKPMTIPDGRFTYPPTDQSFATNNKGKPIDCRMGSSITFSADCGCGVGLDRCTPATTEGFESNAFTFPTQTPLGDAAPFDSADQTPASWLRYWWGQEAVQMLDHVVSGDTDFREVLTGRYSYVNGPLAQFYKQIAPASCCGAGVYLNYTTPEPLFDPKALPASLRPHDVQTWSRVEDRGPHAAGLLTMPVFLTKFGSRRARAHVLYNAFLCKDFVAENVQLTPSTEPNLMMRPGCNACHTALEPLAAYFTRIQESDWTFLPGAQFPLQSTTCKLDKTGKLSSACLSYYDPAFATDQGATMRGAYASSDHAEAGPAALAQALVTAPEFPSCVADNVTSSFLGRALTSEDAALQGVLAKTFQEGGYRMKTLVKALVTSEAYRRANNLTPDAWRKDGAQ